MAIFSWRGDKVGGVARFGDQIIFKLEPTLLAFEDIVLRPGGEPVVNGIFRWREDWIGAPLVIDDYAVEQTGPKVLAFRHRVHSQTNPSLANEALIRVVYDESHNRFCYHVTATLIVLAPGFKSARPRQGFEVFNFWPRHLVADKRWPEDEKRPSSEDDTGLRLGWSETRYTDVIYESGSDTVRLPINQYVHSGSQCKALRPGGRLGFFNHPAGNPTIQLLESTTVPVQADRCHLCHDEHIIGLLGETPWTELPAGLTATFDFQLFDSYGVEAPALMRAAQCPTLPAKDLTLLLPRRQIDLQGWDSFEEPHAITSADPGDFWVPVSGFEKGVSSDWFWASPPPDILAERCIWERRFGRTGFACLKIVTKERQPAGWESVYQAIGVRPASRYLLTAWVKTENLVGKGAFLGYYLGLDFKASEEHKTYVIRHQMEGIRGTQDWTKLQMILETDSGTPLRVADTHLPAGIRAVSEAYAPGGQGAVICIRFWHEGRGTSWWDDVSLICLDEPLHPTRPYRRGWQMLPQELMADLRSMATLLTEHA